MALVSQSDLEARLQRSLTSEEASAFTLINAANQAFLEKKIGSSLEAATSSTRYYDGGLQHLKIDPCTSVTAIKIVNDDQTVTDTLDSSDYTLEPINRTLKTQVRNRGGRFPVGINNIAVTALFSIYADTSILNIVKSALIDALISEIDKSGDIRKESIEGYSVEFAQTATRNALESVEYLFPEII